MNKQAYLLELEHALKIHKVPDIGEILEEYEQHFRFKMADGYSEEEIASKLEQPAKLAEAFADGSNRRSAAKKKHRIIAATGVFTLDLLALPSFLVLYASALAFGSLALGLALLAGCLAGSANIAGLIPPMPYAGALLMGISFAGLALLCGVGTYYSFLYIRQWGRAYLRWHRQVLGSKLYPELSRHPTVEGKARRRLRGLAVAAMILFWAAMITGLLILFADAGFQPFWHVYGWFGGKIGG